MLFRSVGVPRGRNPLCVSRAQVLSNRLARPLWAGIAITVACVPARSQELEPRAYSVSPVGLNFLVTGFGRSTGDLSFDPTLPVQDGHASLQSVSSGYVRTIDFFGRSANVGVQVPYVWGDVSGLVSDVFQSVHRSGLGDPSARFAVNLWGAPAMNARKFARYRQDRKSVV